MLLAQTFSQPHNYFQTTPFVNLLFWLALTALLLLPIWLLSRGHLRRAALTGGAILLAVTLIPYILLPLLPSGWLFLALIAVACLAFLDDIRVALAGALLLLAAPVLRGAPGFVFGELLPLLSALFLLLLLGWYGQMAFRDGQTRRLQRALRLPWNRRRDDYHFAPEDAGTLLDFSIFLATVDLGEIYRRALLGVSAQIRGSHFQIGNYESDLNLFVARSELTTTPEGGDRPVMLSTSHNLDQAPHLQALQQAEEARLESPLSTAEALPGWAGSDNPDVAFRLTLPLRAHGTTLGLLAIARTAALGTFDPHEIELAQAMGAQVGAALANAHIASDARARAAQLSTLNRLSRVFSEHNQLSVMLDEARQELLPLFAATGLSILFQDAADAQLSWAYSFTYGQEVDLRSRSPLPLNSGNAGYVVTTGQPLLISELTDTDYDVLAQFAAGTSPGSWLGVPLIVANQIIGVLVLENADELAAFSQRDVDLLMTIAGPLAIAINNIRQLEQTRAALAAQSEQALLLHTATEVSATATSVLDVQELAQRVVNLIQERFELYYAGLFLVDEGHQEAILQAGTEAAGTALKAEQYRLPLDSNTLVTQAINAGRVHLEPDVRHGANWEFGAYLPNTRSMLAIPLRAQRGGTVGALTVHSSTVDAFTDQAITILQSLCDQLAVAIENARLFQQVQESLIRLNNLFLASRKIMAAERSQTVYETLVDYAGASGLVDMAHLLVADPKEPDFLMLPALWSRIDVEYDPAYRYARDPLPYSPRLLQKDVIFIEDVQQIANNVPAILEMFRRSRMHAVVLVPIYREDQWLGTLVLARSDSKPLARSEIQPFLTLCNQAAAALANQQLFRESTALYRASRNLSQVITRDDAINIVAEEIMQQTKADQCRLILYDIRTGVGKIEYERSETGLASDLQFPMGDDPIFRRLSEERQPVLLHDNGQDEITAASYLRPFHTKTSLLIPALNQQTLIGFMALDLLQGHRRFNNTQINFAQTLVDQLNTQLENLALFDDALSRAQEMITLNQVGVLISGTLDLDQLANVVHEQVGRLLDNSIFILALYEAETQMYRPLLCTRYGERIVAEPRRLEKSESLYEFLYRGTLLVLPDDPVLSEEAGLQELFVSGWVPESALWVPMQQEGEPIGFLSVQSYRPDAYNDNHIQLLRTIATQAGLALANAQSFQRTETTLHEIRQLFEITQSVATAPEPQTRLTRVVDALHRHFQEVDIALFLVNSGEDQLETVISRGHHDFPRQIPIADDLLGRSVIRGKPLLVRDARELPPHEQNDRDALSQIIIPLAFGARVIGILTVESPFPDAFTESDLRLLRTLSVSVAATLESGRLFQEIQLANERLRELDRLKTQFLANMSHELRTPLNSIIGFSRVILKGIDGPVTPEQEHDLNAIYNSGRHLLTLINDILDIARIEAGKMALILEDVDVKEVALDAITTMRGLVQGSNVELRSQFSPHLPRIAADPVRLRQILLNLLSNAAKFTNEGYIQLDIHPEDEHHLHLSVKDTGIGLAESDFERIFTAFEQIEKRDEKSLRGTGLGLPITKRLVDMHQGDIWVESELGEGATFHVVLPIRQANQAENGRSVQILEVSRETKLP